MVFGALVAIVGAALSGAAGRDSGALDVPPTLLRQYLGVARAELASLGIRLGKVQIRGENLRVEFVSSGQLRGIYALACVLEVMRPVARGAGVEQLQVVGYRGDRALFNLTAPLASIRYVYALDLRDEEKRAIVQLVRRCLAKAGVIREAAGEEVGRAAQEEREAARPAEGEAARGERPGAEGAGPEQGKMGEGAELSAEEAKALARELAEAGLENVVVGEAEGGEVFVSVENRTYRYDLEAIGRALGIIGEYARGPVVLQVCRDRVPVSTIRVSVEDFQRLKAGILPSREMVGRWKVESGRAGVGYVRVLAAANRSEGHVDVALRPAVEYEIGNERDPFESDLLGIVDVDTTLAKGLHLRGRFAGRLTSEQEVETQLGLLSYTRWLAPRLLVTGSVGLFQPDLYAWYGEAQYERGPHRVGLIGVAIGDKLGEGKLRQGFGYYEYEFGRWGLTARLGYGRFFEMQEDGFALRLTRRFGESCVSAEAVRTDSGREGLNFRFSFPFGPRVAARPSSVRWRLAPRVRTAYAAKPEAQGYYFFGDHDLASFRGDLSAPYLRYHAAHLVGQRERGEVVGWPVAPSWEGTSGLMRVPTADVVPDGRIQIGASHIGREHSRAQASTSMTPIYGTIGFLPNLEMIARLSVLHDVDMSPWPWPYGLDRSFHLHYRLWRAKENRPAVAIGAQDVQFGTGASYIGRAEYIVATWPHSRWRLHLGAGRHRLQGLFGGVDYDLGRHRMHLMAEYDGEDFNLGVRFFLSRWGNVDLGILGLDEFGGAVSFHRELR